MKLEKVNDHQIRCTLTKADLADRHMKLSELAYGTDKAKNLFRDMLQQASFQFGFDAEDIPLMIEAIPLSGDCIVLIITKVEDPEELDTRFSKFAPAIEASDDGEIEDNSSALSVSADDVIDLFKKLHAGLTETAERFSQQDTAQKAEKTVQNVVKVEEDLTRMYRFDSIGNIIRLSHVLSDFYSGENNLYKCDNPDGFYLVVHKSEHTPEEFNKVCNIMAEYSQVARYSKALEAFLDEHAELMLYGTALQELAQIQD